MNYGTYTATTAQIPLLRHISPLLRHKYRYCGTYTVTTAHISLLRHIYRYYGTYHRYCTWNTAIYTGFAPHHHQNTKSWDLRRQFCIVKHTKRSQKSQKTGQPLVRHIYRYYPRNTAICSTFAPFRNEWRCRGGQTSNPGRRKTPKHKSYSRS